MDFDDLLMKTVVLFREHGDVLEHYRQRFEHILVDEYQDTNQAQNEMILMLAGGHQNVCVVGDTDQCLPPGSMVSTPSGPVPIEQVEVGDVVMGAAGGSATHPGTVVHVHEGRYDGHLVEITAAGRTISATPHHLVPARLVPRADTWLVYLMYRADRGWRIGRTIGARPPVAGKLQHGLFVRCNQEHADAAWILKTCDSMAEAAYFESFFAAEYGLPTDVFPLDRTRSRHGRRVASAAVPVDRHGDSGEAADGGSSSPRASSLIIVRRTVPDDRRST